MDVDVDVDGAGKHVVVRAIVTAAIKRHRNKGHKTSDERCSGNNTCTPRNMDDVSCFVGACEWVFGCGWWPYIMAHMAPPPRTSRRPLVTFQSAA